MARTKGMVTVNTSDIIGKSFGKLQVIAYENWRYDDSSAGCRVRHFYLCKCDCGKEVIVRRQCLLNDGTKSCGCLKRGRKRKHGN